MTSKQQSTIRTRKQSGTLLELALALPFIILVAIALVNLAQIYYTHNLMQHSVTDASTKVATLTRLEFFASGVDDNTYRSRVITAIKNDLADIARLESTFLDAAGGFNITFEDLSGGGVNTLAGALTMFYQEDLNTAETSYVSGGVPADITAACTTNLTPGQMRFNPYRVTLQFAKVIPIKIFRQNLSFTIRTEASDVLQNLTPNQICTAMGL